MNSKYSLIPFFTAGFPELGSTKKILEILDNQKNIDYIEIGLPHSDALADGETIQNSSEKAIQNGMNIKILFEQINSYSAKTSKLILFTYYNPLIAYGLEKSLKEWKKAGGSCILIPDLPVEECNEVLDICKELDIKLIFLITPLSDSKRIEKIVSLSTEFIYLVSTLGVTGLKNKEKQETYDSKLKEIIDFIKTLNPNMKIMLGFGIGTTERAKKALSFNVDGIIIGSAFVKLLEDGIEEKKILNFLSGFQEL